MVLNCREVQTITGVKQYPVQNLYGQEDNTDHFKILMAQLFNKTILITGCSKFFFFIISQNTFLFTGKYFQIHVLQRQYLLKTINTTFTVFTVNTPLKSEVVTLHPAPHLPNNHFVHQQRQLQHPAPVEAITVGRITQNGVK